LDPPGTMRMFFSGPNCCTGYVLLSRKLSVATDISTFAPMRNPSRMPFFTHALTFQPVELAGSGSAARISPRLRASRNLPKVARLPALYSAGLLSKSCSISVCMMYQKAAGFEHLLDLRLAGGGRRDQRETPHRFEQAHHRHRGLHGSGAGLDEVDVHQRQELLLDFACSGVVAGEAMLRELRHLGRDFVGDHADDAASAKRAERDSDRVIATEDGELGRDFLEDGRHLADIAAGF